MRDFPPNFGPDPPEPLDGSNAVVDSGAMTPFLSDSRMRSKSSRSPVRAKVNPFLGSSLMDVKDIERGELYSQLHRRFQELRSFLTSRRAELGKLRSEYSMKVSELRANTLSPTDESVVNERLKEAIDACLVISEEIKREREEPLSDSEKLSILKGSLSDVQTWNVHVASFMKFFHHQMHAIRNVAAPVGNVGLPSSKHWTP